MADMGRMVLTVIMSLLLIGAVGQPASALCMPETTVMACCEPAPCATVQECCQCGNLPLQSSAESAAFNGRVAPDPIVVAVRSPGCESFAPCPTRDAGKQNGIRSSGHERLVKKYLLHRSLLI